MVNTLMKETDPSDSEFDHRQVISPLGLDRGSASRDARTTRYEQVLIVVRLFWFSLWIIWYLKK